MAGETTSIRARQHRARRRCDPVGVLAAVVLAAMLVLSGCSAVSDSADSGQSGPDTDGMSTAISVPDESADLTGTVVSVEPGEQTRPSASAPSGVLVEAASGAATRGKTKDPAKGERYLLNVKVTPDTGVLVGAVDAGLSEASAAEVEPDRSVEVWHSPETGRSYPAQAQAQTIVIGGSTR